MSKRKASEGLRVDDYLAHDDIAFGEGSDLGIGVTYHFPWPPTVNTYWRNVNGRTLLSRRGREYRAEVLAMVLSAAVKQRFECRLAVDIEAHPPDKRRRDLDNLPKGILDAMQHAGVYADDSQVDRLTISRRNPDPGSPRVVVTVRPCG